MTNANTDFSQARVALLIDTDNISDKHVDEIFKYAAEKGNVIVRRGYGVMRFNWNKEEMFRYAIEPVTRFVHVSGKNVTDIALVIDALDLAYRKIIDVVCIVSNDSDFSLLAMKLREQGVQVYGVGTEDAQESFIASCDDFERLPSFSERANDSVSAPDNSDIKNDSGIPNLEEAKNILKDACERCEDESGWALASQVGTYIKRVQPAFSAKNYGYSKFSALVKATEVFDYDDKKSTAPKIRIK